MVIAGYPCIGKSTLAKREPIYIDLESSYFPDKTQYCYLAEDLSQQGKIVFVSTHPEVIRYFTEESNEDFYVCYPSLNLYGDWVLRAALRYRTTKTDKDERALTRVATWFDADINELMELKDATHIVITSADQVLKNVIEAAIHHG